MEEKEEKKIYLYAPCFCQIGVKVKKMYGDVILPEYKTEGSAGCDVRAYLCNSILDVLTEGKMILRGKSTGALIPTGLRIRIPKGFYMAVVPRSGMSAKTTMRVANAPGTVDCFSSSSEIMTANGNKSIHNLKIKETIVSCNEKMETEKDEVVAIVSLGEKDIFVVETDSGTLEITGNTEVYTSKGIKYAKDLKEGDEVISL